MSKTNTTHLEGSQNIVIQDVSASNITINVNGVEHKLEAAMNQWLTQQLMPIIAQYDVLAQKFGAATNSINQWQNQPKYRNAALSILQSSYIGVVGIYLKKLAAIGSSSFSTTKVNEYTKNAYLLVQRLLDLTNTLLISTLWDNAEKQRIALSKTEKIKQFFGQTVERDIAFSFELLSELIENFAQTGTAFPIPEFGEAAAYFAENKLVLQLAFTKIETIYQQSNQKELSGEDCFWVEKHLTDILLWFAFYAGYKIQAVKEVMFNQIRKQEEFYIHKLSFYGLSNRSTEQQKEVSENIRFSHHSIYTDAVLFYKDDYGKGINLFPFIIEYNNVLLEEGTNLCVFSHKELAAENLVNFIAFADAKLVGIEADNTKLTNDFSEIFSNRISTIQHKKNIVVQLLTKAETDILGNEDNSGEDFLNGLLNG